MTCMHFFTSHVSRCRQPQHNVDAFRLFDVSMVWRQTESARYMQVVVKTERLISYL